MARRKNLGVRIVEVPVGELFHFTCGCEARVKEHSHARVSLFNVQPRKPSTRTLVTGVWYEVTEYCRKCAKEHTTSNFAGAQPDLIVKYDPILSILGF